MLAHAVSFWVLPAIIAISLSRLALAWMSEAARLISLRLIFCVAVVVMFVLVLVVVSVARGNRDNLGNAEQIEKTFLQLFLRDPRNPLFH
jgi:hypothetical protein